MMMWKRSDKSQLGQNMGPMAGFALSDAQFKRISVMVKDMCGINLIESKKQLVKARLNSRLRELNMQGFDAYLSYLKNDRSGSELVSMLDAISTNLTNFFREPMHFDYLREVMIPRAVARKGKRFRVWSAGCSSGEEPYTIAITLMEHLPAAQTWDAKILATDLSTEILERASHGIYEQERFKGMPKMLISKYFNKVNHDKETAYQVKDFLRKMVTVGRLNLMGNWPMKGPFDVIFCRNVMIYFDKPTQERLINRYANLLGPKGTLFIGHSESLTGTTHDLQYVKPTVYER